MDDAAIHRVLGNAGGLSVRLLRASGSPRAYALAMTRVVWVRSVCHCEERAERGTRQSIVSRDILSKGAVHLLRVSGSPRAYALAMTRVTEGDDKGEQVIYQSVLRSFQLGFSRSINLILVDRFPALSCFSLLMAFPTTSKDSKYTSFLSPYLFENPS